jgi:hypothetical protein
VEIRALRYFYGTQCAILLDDVAADQIDTVFRWFQEWRPPPVLVVTALSRPQDFHGVFHEALSTLDAQAARDLYVSRVSPSCGFTQSEVHSVIPLCEGNPRVLISASR